MHLNTRDSQAAQLKSLTWGGTQSLQFNSAADVTLAAAQLAQLVQCEAKLPCMWLVQVVIDVAGFAPDEAAPVNVTIQSTVGLGQTKRILRKTYTLVTPEYAMVFDQGVIPAASLQIEAFISGGPYTVHGRSHVVNVSAFVAPTVGGGPSYEEQCGIIAALRGE